MKKLELFYYNRSREAMDEFSATPQWRKLKRKRLMSQYEFYVKIMKTVRKDD